jgi:hypothetical protein
MAKLELLGRVSINSKSFYFNKGTAKSGVKYLAINAKTGDRREQLVIFENQLAAFVAETNRVIALMLNNKQAEPVAAVAVAAVACEACHSLENEVWVPLRGTGDPDERCSTCGRQL